tara:strand:- start:1330 stop:2760 length:1431 start_codon:yes stop_codon:yes gene_type:complete
MTTVTEPRIEYTDQLIDVQRNRAAVAGERSVKRGGVVFLPPLASMCCSITYNDSGEQQFRQNVSLTLEGQAAYNKYLALSSFYGATGRTVDGLVGLIFSKKPVSELPSLIEYLGENADSKGNSLRDLAKKASTEAMISPRSGLLVARPSTPEGSSVATVELNNLRPKILSYKFEDIINWDYTVVNNVEKLSLVVLCELTTKRNGFKVETEKQYRVLELIEGVYHQSLYNDGGELTEAVLPVTINGSVSDEIPFYFIEVGAEGKAIINDLVDMNFHHYQVSADYNSKNHFSSFIIWYETGAQSGQNMLMGNGVKWSNQATDATFGILQPDGNADALRISLQDDEQRMAALGAEALKPRQSGAESAEAKSLDQVAQNSTTADVAITVSETLTKALNFAAKWMGSTEEAVYQLNTDYNPTGMNAQSLTAMVAAYQGGAISYDTLYENLQRGEIATSERTAQDERTLIQNANTGMDDIIE